MGVVTDAFRTLPSLATAAASQAAERWRGGEGGSVETAAGLEWILRERHPEVRIARVTPLGSSAGTTRRLRLAVRWARPPVGFDPPPRHLFVKLPPSEWSTRLFVDLMDLGRNEVGFYRDIRPAAPIEAPRALAARRAARGRGTTLVLEDLSDAGCRFGEGSRKLDFDTAVAGLRTLARLHAAFWESPRIERDWRWLAHPDANRPAPLERLLGRAALGPALRRYGDCFTPSVRDAAPRILASRSSLDRAWAAGPRTVIHGDPHLGNLYFCGSEVGLLDWQVVQAGAAMRDVGYFLINAVDPGVLEKGERELIASYLEILQSFGAPAPSPDAAFEQFRIHALYVFIAVVVTAASGRMQGPEVVEPAIRDVCAALERLDAVAALGGLDR